MGSTLEVSLVVSVSSEQVLVLQSLFYPTVLLNGNMLLARAAFRFMKLYLYFMNIPLTYALLASSLVIEAVVVVGVDTSVVLVW